MAISKCLCATCDDAISDSKSLKSIKANSRERREGFMDAASPIGQSVIRESVKGRAGSDDMHIVEAPQLPLNLEGAKKR
jgi:hypothetical protein